MLQADVCTAADPVVVSRTDQVFDADEDIGRRRTRDRQDRHDDRSHVDAHTDASAIHIGTVAHRGRVVDGVGFHAAVQAVAKTDVGGIHDDAVVTEAAGDAVVAQATVDQVVFFAAINDVVACTAVDRVITCSAGNHIGFARAVHHLNLNTGEGLSGQRAGFAINQVIAHAAVDHICAQTAAQGVVARAAKQGIDAGATVEVVIALIAPDEVITLLVGDHIATQAAMQEVVATTAFDGVVAAITPDGVIAALRIDALGVVGAADHFAGIAFDRGCVVRAEGAPRIQVFTRIAIEGVVRAVKDPARGVDLMADALDIVLKREATAQAVKAAGCIGLAECCGVRELDGRVGHAEDVAVQVLDTGIAHHDVREELRVNRSQQVGAGQTIEVVEAVRVLQVDHLVGKDEIEGRAQHAARHLGLGQTTQPEVDVVQAGLAIHEGGVVNAGNCGCPQRAGIGGRVRKLQGIPRVQALELGAGR